MGDTKHKPFSKEYVLQVTALHMKKAVDISIRKTSERIEEFAGDQEKSREVLETLVMLNMIRNQL